jgi:hypothetical protein
MMAARANAGLIKTSGFFLGNAPAIDGNPLDCITMSAPSTVHCGCMTTIGSEERSRT